MKIFSTFTGIGGFELGIRNAFMRNQDKELRRATSKTGSETGHIEQRPELSDQGLSFIGYSEIDKYAISVYERNFRHGEDCRLARKRERDSSTSGRQETLDSKRTRLPQDNRNNDDIENERSENCDCTPPINYGDITKINADELPDFDCLVGGFPCQAFSIAGKRAGFNDTRGTLFFDLARILRAKQPRLFVFENVKGLLSHDGGRTFSTIIQAIDELGYDCQWQVINSKNHGVPQNRERIIIVGHLRGTPRPQVFPIGSTNQKDTRIVGQDVAYTIDANSHKGTNTLAKSRRSVVQLNQPTHSNDRVYGTDGISPTLNTMQGVNRQPFISEPPKIRRLTPTECERLQAFPDDWTKYGKDGELISDTQRYKMCGNAVTTNVIQAVFERIFND